MSVPEGVTEASVGGVAADGACGFTDSAADGGAGVTGGTGSGRIADVSAGCSTLADCDGRSSDFADSGLFPSSRDAVSLFAESGLAESGLAESGLADSGLADSALPDSGLADSDLADSGLFGSGLGSVEVVAGSSGRPRLLILCLAAPLRPSG
jgi:hypothetical protein